MTLAFSQAYSKALDAQIRANRGLLPHDLFCKNCGDYKSEHGGDAQDCCLFAPTKYVALGAEEWRSVKSEMMERQRLERLSTRDAWAKQRFFGGRK